MGVVDGIVVVVVDCWVGRYVCFGWVGVEYVGFIVCCFVY